MLIGISGKKQHGKDTVANFIIKNTRIEWETRKFADKLKDVVCLLLGCTREQLEDPEFKEKPLDEQWWYYNIAGELRLRHSFLSDEDNEMAEDRYLVKPTPRLILQLMGTECGRKILHPNLWVNSTMSEYIDESNWIITDVRFPNEVKAIKDAGGVVIRVNRNSIESNDNHESETALDDYTDWDYVINNDDNLINLNLSVVFMLNKLKISLK